MRGLRVLLLALGVCLLWSAPVLCRQTATPANASGGFAIRGTVVEHASNRPLSRVLVTALHSPQGDRAASSVTATDGTFVIDRLPPGKYNLSAQARGYATQAFRQNDNYSTGIAVGPGLDSEHIVFPLIPPGSISGSVMDQDGDSVGQAQVWLFFKSVSAGRSQIVMRNGQNTDSSGSFHFGHLAPGTYFVGVHAHPWYADNNPGIRGGDPEGPSNSTFSELDVAYPTTYYADTLDPAAASPITITEGNSTTIQIALRAVPALHVRLSGYSPKAGTNVFPNVMEIGPGGQITVNGGATSISANGETELMGVAPGHYILSMQTVAQGHPEPLGTRVVDLTGSTTVDVSGVSKSTISGHIAFEGTERPSGQTNLAFMESGTQQRLQAMVEADGSFTTIDNPLTAGRYSIALPNRSGFYLKSIEVKGANFTRGELDIPEGASVQLSLVAAKGAAPINGIALKDEKPIAGAMVLLIPQDLNRADLIRRDQSDSDGTFTLPDVAPGHYTALAIDDGTGLEYAEPSVIKPYLSLGAAVTISGQNDPSLKLQVVPRRQ